MLRILIADDHAVYRHGLRCVLADELKDVVFGEAREARELLTLLEREDWNLLLLDITLPGRSGLDLLPDIKKLRPNLPVLIVSMHPEEEFGVRALQAGAAGYVWKQNPVESLVAAVRAVLGGARYISARLAEQLAHELQHGFRPAHARLSAREFEVMRMIARGSNTKSIAAELSLSPKTVSTYRARVLKKLRLRTDADIVRYAMHNRLIE